MSNCNLFSFLHSKFEFICHNELRIVMFGTIKVVRMMVWIVSIIRPYKVGSTQFYDFDAMI